jgi:hypothetical protein
MDMRWRVVPLAVAVFSIASLSSAATLELGDVFDSARGRGNGDRIRYSGNADFGTVDLRERSGHGRGRHCTGIQTGRGSRPLRAVLARHLD